MRSLHGWRRRRSLLRQMPKSLSSLLPHTELENFSRVSFQQFLYNYESRQLAKIPRMILETLKVYLYYLYDFHCTSICFQWKRNLAVHAVYERSRLLGRSTCRKKIKQYECKGIEDSSENRTRVVLPIWTKSTVPWSCFSRGLFHCDFYSVKKTSSLRKIARI